MNTSAIEHGLLTGGLPYARLGSAPHKLVILPGLADAVADVHALLAELPSQFGTFAQEFTVYVISRKRGLAPGCTTRDMAADYGRALQKDIGAAAVLGISLGGCIAQHLAADFPQIVTQLVIGCAAHRVSEVGRQDPQRWLDLAGAKRWRAFYFDIARVTLRIFQQTFYQFLTPLWRRNAINPADFLISLRASITHDASAVLASITAPTLVIGGKLDPFFPEPLLRELAARLPNAELLLIDDCGHAAYALRKQIFEAAVLDFLRRTPLVTNSESASEQPAPQNFLAVGRALRRAA